MSINPGAADSWHSRKRATLGLALVLTSAGIPLLFQGQEFCEDRWFDDRTPLSWDKTHRHSGFLHLARQLIGLRTNVEGNTAGLRGAHTALLRLDHERKLLAYHRWWQGGAGDDVIVAVNLSAQLTQVHEVDVTRIVQLRKKAKASFQQQAGVNLTYLPFITKAVAEALKQHPKLNASFSEDNKEITYHASEDIAIAVDTEKGLLVPVIKDAGSLNLTGLAQKIADVAERTRTNKISPDELSGGTFSITNIGSVGALFDTPIINQPQVGILGTGIIVKRPVVITGPDGDDTIAIRSMMYLSLTYDHRLVDGADAGRFLQTLKARLEGGAFEADLGL